MNDKIRLYIQIIGTIILVGGILSTAFTFYIDSKLMPIILSVKDNPWRDKMINSLSEKASSNSDKISSLQILVNTKFSDSEKITNNQQVDINHLLYRCRK